MIQNANREILLAILRAEQVRSMTTEQWQAIVHLAKQHRVQTILYRQLKAMELINRVPDDLLQNLRSQYLRTATRNLRIYLELGKLFGAYEELNVPRVLLKGAYLAEAIYRNLAARPMGDVDVLVPKVHLKRVDEIMEKMDYRRTHHLREPLKDQHHFGYIHARHGLYVEVHWDLIGSAHGIHVDIEALWERTQSASIAGIAVREMSPEDQILHLCVHTSVHVFEIGLRALCDLNETLRQFRQTIDWECLRQRTCMWGAERCLYVNLWLARQLLDAPFPNDLLTAIMPKESDLRHVGLAHEHIFECVEETDKALPAAASAVQFWTAKKLTGKLNFLFQRMFLSRQMMATMYPAPPESFRIFLYYPVRWKDMLKRHGRVTWNLFRRDAQIMPRAERQAQVEALRSWRFSG